MVRGLYHLRRHARTARLALLASFLLGLGFAAWHVGAGTVSATVAVNDGTVPGRPVFGHDDQTCQACSIGTPLPPAAPLSVLPDVPAGPVATRSPAPRHQQRASLDPAAARPPPAPTTSVV